MGIDHLYHTASDIKKLAQRWLLRHSKALHVYQDSRDHVAGKGRCLRHGITCTPAQHADLVTGGLPCQPFSDMRVKSGATSNTREPEVHSQYDIVTIFPDLLEQRKPGGFVVV